jgi:hypothetical protein
MLNRVDTSHAKRSFIRDRIFCEMTLSFYRFYFRYSILYVYRGYFLHILCRFWLIGDDPTYGFKMLSLSKEFFHVNSLQQMPKKISFELSADERCASSELVRTRDTTLNEIFRHAESSFIIFWNYFLCFDKCSWFHSFVCLKQLFDESAKSFLTFRECPSHRCRVCGLHSSPQSDVAIYACISCCNAYCAYVFLSLYCEWLCVSLFFSSSYTSLSTSSCNRFFFAFAIFQVTPLFIARNRQCCWTQSWTSIKAIFHHLQKLHSSCMFNK